MKNFIAEDLIAIIITAAVLVAVVLVLFHESNPDERNEGIEGIEEALGRTPDLQVVWIIKGRGWRLRPYSYVDFLPEFNERMAKENAQAIRYEDPLELSSPLWSHGSWFTVDHEGVTYPDPRSAQIVLGPRAMMVARSLDGKNRQFLLFNSKNCLQMISVLEAPQIK